MPHVFGKAISYIFTPLANGEPVKVDSLVSARIYSDAPTETQIETTTAGQGELDHITTWASEGNFAYKISFAALTDDDEHSSASYETFHVVVSFKYDATGETKWAKEVIHVYRPDAWQSRISATYVDVYDVDHTFELLQTPGEVEARIKVARETVVLDLEAKGYERSRLFNLEKLNRAVVYCVLADYFLESISDDNRAAEIKYTKYKELYDKRLSTVGVGYDVAGADTPAAEDHAADGSYVMFAR